MNRQTELLAALVAGAAVGVAVGLLAAPQKGATTRRMIRRKGEDIVDAMSDSIKDTIDDCGDSLVEKVESLKNDIVGRFSS